MLPGGPAMRRLTAEPPPLDAHNALALTLSESLGVAPDPADWPRPCEPPLFGPVLPPRYRLSGPGGQPGAAARFARQPAASPRAPVDPDDVDELRRFGWAAAAARATGSFTVAQR